MSADEPIPTAEPTTPEPQPGSSRAWKVAAAVAVLAAVSSIGVLGALLFGGGSGEAAADVRACIVDPASRDFTKGATEGEEAPEGDDHARPAGCPPEGARQIDGLVEETDVGGFTLREIIDGQRLGDVVELHVREPDRPYIDVAHAQTHAALGQPIRVYVLEVDGRESVVYMEDAPLLG